MCFSQNTVDSLRNLIDETNDAQQKIDLRNVLAYELIDHSLEESQQTSQQNIHESRKINYSKGEGWALIYNGMYFMLSGNPNHAREVQKQALAAGKRIDDKDIMAYACLQIGKSYRDNGYFDSTLYYFKQAESYQLGTGNAHGLCQIYSSLSKFMVYSGKAEFAIHYAEKSLEQAVVYGIKPRIAYSWLDLGDAHRDNYNFIKARECYATALNVAQGYNWVSTDYNESIGLLQLMEGDFEGSFTSLNIVVQAYEGYHGKYALCRNLIKMGEILEERGLFAIASEYLFKALRIADESNYNFLSGEAHYEVAWVNFRANQLTNATVEIRQAQRYYQKINHTLLLGGCLNVMGLIKMKSNDFDSSFYYLNAGLKERKKHKSLAAVSSSIFNIGDLYLSFKKYSEALPYFLDGEQIDSHINDKYGVGLCNHRIGRVFINMGRYSEAEEYLKKALKNGLEVKSFDLLSYIYSDFEKLYEIKGNLSEALKFQKLLAANTDSIYSKGAAESLASNRTLYDLNQKDQQIELLNKNKLLQQEEIRLRNIILNVLVGIVIALALFAIIYYRYSKRLKRLNAVVQEKNEEVQTQSEELLESNNRLTDLNTEVTLQREEIKKQAEELLVSNEAIATINQGLEKMIEQRTVDLRTAYQELDTFFYRSSHDFRRPLTTLMGLSEVAKLSVKDTNALELFEKVSYTAINLDKMLVKLQSISDVGSHQLILKEVLLKHIIENEVIQQGVSLNRKNVKVTTEVNLNKPFISYPALVKIIIENLIENAVVFSPPQHALVSIRAFRQDDDKIAIEVSDNGEGVKAEIKDQLFEMFFRGSERSQGNGLGLYIAKRATERLSGTISFRNNETGGATFSVVLPCHG